MSPAAFHYAAYGLRIASEIALPLSAASAEGEPDLRIRVGAVPEALAAPRIRRETWEAAPDLFLLKAEGVARYLVREGCEVVVEPVGDGVGDRDGGVDTFLLGSVFAACLRQRGTLTLHAACVATGEGAAVLAGESGAGKSTLVATLVDREYTLLSDDVTGIVVDGGGRPAALPAVPGVLLWADAVEALGWQERTREQVRDGIEKYWTPIAAGQFRDAQLPVRAVFILTTHNRAGIEMETLAPVDGFDCLTRYIYRKLYVRGLGRGQECFRVLVALARQVPVVRVARPVHGLPVAALADRIEACLRKGVPPAEKRLLGQREGGTALRGGHAASRLAHGSWRGVETGSGEAASGSIVWLASYPRSGNTWLRALLTNYMEGREEPASIDALLGRPVSSLREVLDEEIGLSSSDLTQEEILRRRSYLHELLAAELPRPSFVKVHDAFMRTGDGSLLFPPVATLGAVYVVRNPLDVAVSLAHFWSWPMGRAVAELNRADASLSSPVRGMHAVLPQPLSTWSGHVASWLDQRELPVHVVRYDDLLADTEGAFGAILRFADIEPEAKRVARAVEYARFDRLRAQEERAGFAEKPPTARFFFRNGQAGSWREALSQEQVRLLTDAHAPLMERFGYLHEAEAFLRDGGREIHGALGMETPQ